MAKLRCEVGRLCVASIQSNFFSAFSAIPMSGDFAKRELCKTCLSIAAMSGDFAELTSPIE